MATKHATKKAKRATKKAAKRSTKSPSPRKLLLISALSSSHAILKIGHGAPVRSSSATASNSCYKCETLILIESALKAIGIRLPVEAA
jgi:hypothetical protein